MSDPELTDFQRGLKEGRVDALLDEHTKRLNKINGSVERHARSVETLAKNMHDGFEKVASEIRTMQEEARLDRERVKVAAETLAAERRAASQRQSGAWSLRASKATVGYLLVAVGSVAVAVYEALH